MPLAFPDERLFLAIGTTFQLLPRMMPTQVSLRFVEFENLASRFECLFLVANSLEYYPNFSRCLPTALAPKCTLLLESFRISLLTQENQFLLGFP